MGFPDTGGAALAVCGSVLLNFGMPAQNVEALIRRTLAQNDPNLTVFNAQVVRNFNEERRIARPTSLYRVGDQSGASADCAFYFSLSWIAFSVSMACCRTRSGVSGTSCS